MENETKYKTMKGEYGDVMYAEYIYRNITYMQSELDVETEMKIGEILTQLEIDNLRSLSDVVNLKIGAFISSALKHRMAPKLLATVLRRADGVRVSEEEFTKGLARDFNPFFKKVAQDFFSLNRDVLTPITGIASKIGEQWRTLEQFLRQLKSSINSVKATSQSGRA